MDESRWFTILVKDRWWFNHGGLRFIWQVMAESWRVSFLVARDWYKQRSYWVYHVNTFLSESKRDWLMDSCYAFEWHIWKIMFGVVPLMEFMYLLFTRMSGESYRRWLRSLLYMCYIFRALINSLVCCHSIARLSCISRARTRYYNTDYRKLRNIRF